jgi:hypothetical protein
MKRADAAAGQKNSGQDMRDPDVTAQAGVNQGEASILGLLQRLTQDLARLFRQEAALATAEFSRACLHLARGIGAIAAAAALIYAGLLVLLAAAVLGLMQLVPGWEAALIVGGATVALGLILLLAGRPQLSAAGLKPTRSAQSLRQDRDVLTRRAPAP